MDGNRAIVRPLTGSKTAAQPAANITINVYAAEGQSEEKSIAQRVAQLLQERLTGGMQYGRNYMGRRPIYQRRRSR